MIKPDLMEEARQAFEPIRADLALARGIQCDRAIEAIASALAAAEARGREEAAKIAEKLMLTDDGRIYTTAKNIAAAIRRSTP